ncbi:flagellin [Noviherbaspirillum humi]|uniref:Flagellin n=1 Tax=Noviherbaspirillum humi TaxID=1688639 RepID=A0A239G062_9BURK|nr:flagellin [Noviherbaspirillum humi]SNS61922.1 flagellin [Noviherbaspirillum humi]
MSVINTNIASINTQRTLNSSQADLQTSIQRLSSGLRVNSAKDDAAGLSIATKMDSSIRGMNVAVRNANDGISMVQTAEGALGTISDALQRMRELAVQSANGSNGAAEQSNLDLEFQQLKSEIGRVRGNTTFNGNDLLGSAATSATLQIGAGTSSGDSLTVSFSDIASSTTGSGFAAVTASSGSDITSAANAKTAMSNIDQALKEINTMRSTFGAAQNRLNYAINNLQTSTENTSAARSRIMDADYASETAKLSRNQILQQAGTAMLAQANALPQGVLSLLRG